MNCLIMLSRKLSNQAILPAIGAFFVDVFLSCDLCYHKCAHFSTEYGQFVSIRRLFCIFAQPSAKKIIFPLV